MLAVTLVSQTSFFSKQHSWFTAVGAHNPQNIDIAALRPGVDFISSANTILALDERGGGGCEAQESCESEKRELHCWEVWSSLSARTGDIRLQSANVLRVKLERNIEAIFILLR
jgi:hypothetical protein